ncbi:MAG: hypothetical protein AAF730_00170 [Bacteroidota bacterium]
MNSPQNPEPAAPTGAHLADHPLASFQDRLADLHDWVTANDRTAMLGTFCAGVLIGVLLRR